MITSCFALNTCLLLNVYFIIACFQELLNKDKAAENSIKQIEQAINSCEDNTSDVETSQSREVLEALKVDVQERNEALRAAIAKCELEEDILAKRKKVDDWKKQCDDCLQDIQNQSHDSSDVANTKSQLEVCIDDYKLFCFEYMPPAKCLFYNCVFPGAA